MSENKMASNSIKKLVLKMGIPMIVSMILQALYNVIDTMFVMNMGEGAIAANQALGLVFPVQILMIAIGVGTGVGINAMLSMSLGKGDKEMANKTAGNGIFLALIFFLLFLIFGLFLTKPYMNMVTSSMEAGSYKDLVIESGAKYLKICCTVSIGSIGYAVAERFLIATGKTLFSMISQVTGALLNIILDYILIYPCKLGIAGAAYATIIGQCASLVLALIFHIFINKEISHNPLYIKPSLKVIGLIYKIGFPALLMQAMLSIMMLGTNSIIGTIKDTYTINLLQNSFGIYYKLMQIALFASFGLSNTLISLVSFNYGMKSKERIIECAKYGIIDTLILTLIITVLYECFANLLTNLFAQSADSSSSVSLDDIKNSVTFGLRISAIGYVFMGFSVAIQGVLQGLNDIYKPLIISFLRLILIVMPLTFIFTRFDNAQTLFWFAFPITEVLTSIPSYFMLKDSIKKKVLTISE